MTPYGAATPMRIGFGFDFHRFSDSGTLVLGGCTFRGFPALYGHSDADVLIHAAMDAILGAAGEVDIGTLFPDTDETYLNACSKDLAKQAVRIVREAGFLIVNFDAVLICDRPMIAPYRPKIRSSMAEAFGIDISQVNVKGKTHEGLTGRGEGIEAMVTALLSRAGD